MKLNTKRTILVGLAFFSICTFWQAYDNIIPKILTDKFGMSQTVSGFVMALDNILALFMLPLFGAISDRCTSKRGRRTPFIIVGTIVAAITFIGLSFVDNMQLAHLKEVQIGSEKAMEALYDADLTIKTPDGDKIVIQEAFSKDEFTSIEMEAVDKDGKAYTTEEYTNYVVPARQAYAWQATVNNPLTLVFFMVMLLVTLVSMSIYRSPAVALMPDITMKPLRSKANAIINLLGAVGGIIVLILGMVFGTGKTKNALMSYSLFFSVVAVIMVVALIVFLLTVNEPKLVEKMKEDSKKYGILDNEEDAGGDKKLSKSEFTSLLLILASVVLWFMGYNAVTSKYSVYAGTVLNLDYNATLTIASAAAILTYIPVGIISSKIGRKKTILAGIIILGGAFLAASFMRSGSSQLLMNILFALAGVGWATINVNSYPMVVELSRGSNVGKYTGFYYTASMAAQTITPMFSGIFLDIKMTTLFPYATIFVLLAFGTMLFVKHGDNKPSPANSKLEAFDVAD